MAKAKLPESEKARPVMFTVPAKILETFLKKVKRGNRSATVAKLIELNNKSPLVDQAVVSKKKTTKQKK